MSRDVIAGNQINLRARFKDDLGDAALASGVSVYIYDPDDTIPSFSSSDPDYVGEGIYQYGFTTPGDAEEGAWTDLWYGMLNGQQLSGEFTFNVYSVGEVEEIGNQLYPNNLIEVTLTSGIQATDGTYLPDTETIEFLTTTSPSYTEIRKVKLEAGGYISSLPDMTIQMAILEASLEADVLTFSSYTNTNLFRHARREWTTCKVASILIDNITSHSIKAKTLADLHVEYDPGSIMKTLSRILDCLSKWEPQLISGGYAKSAQQPQGVIKGEYDPDRAKIGRGWDSMDGELSDRIPAANTRDKESWSYRYKNIYKNKKRFW